MTHDMLWQDSAPRGPARHGPARAAVESSLKAWRRLGFLLGPEDAARRRVIRDSADAVDAAHGALEEPRCQACGTPVKDAYRGSPHTLAYANSIHAQLLATVQPASGAAADPYTEDNADDELAAAIAAALSAGPDVPEADDPAPGDDV